MCSVTNQLGPLRIKTNLWLLNQMVVAIVQKVTASCSHCSVWATDPCGPLICRCLSQTTPIVDGGHLELNHEGLKNHEGSWACIEVRKWKPFFLFQHAEHPGWIQWLCRITSHLDFKYTLYLDPRIALKTLKEAIATLWVLQTLCSNAATCRSPWWMKLNWWSWLHDEQITTYDTMFLSPSSVFWLESN